MTRASTPQPNGGLSPSATGRLSTPASRRSCVPGPSSASRLLAPSLELSRSHLQSFDGQRLRHHCWRFIAAGWPGPPGSRAISLFFQGAGRLHVNVGWRHPRPVAANDGPIVSGSRTAPGIASGQSARPLGEQIANAHAGAAPGTGDPDHAKNALLLRPAPWVAAVQSASVAERPVAG